MISQKFRVENSLLEKTATMTEMADKVKSKECVTKFTKLFIDNIIYERKILNKNNFEEIMFRGIKLRKLKDSNDDRLSHHLKVYFEGIKDAIEKEYLKELIFRFCLRKNPEETVEQYHIGFTYLPDNNPKICEESKTTMTIKSVIDNMKSSLNRYFDPLPSLSDLDIYIHLKFYEDVTPQEYIAPYFTESKKNLNDQLELACCKFGAVKTPFVKVQGIVQGYSTVVSVAGENEIEDDISLPDSQEEQIYVIDDD